MFITVVPLANTCIALNDEAIVCERTEIIKAIKIGRNLRTDASREIAITMLEYRPFDRAGNCIDDLQAEAAHWQLRKLAVCLAASSHRDGANQSGTTRRSRCNYVQARAAELESIILINRHCWHQTALQSHTLLINVVPRPVRSILLAQEAGESATRRSCDVVAASCQYSRILAKHVRARVAEISNALNCRLSACPFSAWIDDQHCASLPAEKLRCENGGWTGIDAFSWWWQVQDVEPFNLFQRKDTGTIPARTNQVVI